MGLRRLLRVAYWRNMRCQRPRFEEVCGRTFSRLLERVHPFEDGALRGVALALVHADDAGVAAVAFLERGRDFLEQDFRGVFLVQTRATARRRSWTVPLLPSVTIFSATERAALALASVVVTRLCLIRLQTRLASIALRCSPVRPSLAVRLRCRIKLFVTQSAASASSFGASSRPGFKVHARATSQAPSVCL